MTTNRVKRTWGKHTGALPDINRRVRDYMAKSMAMRDIETDQEQNWIFGHMVTLLHLEQRRWSATAARKSS